MTMNFAWNNETIRYFKNASKYTGFHKTLGELIRPHLSTSNTLGDIGCGLGLLDLEISPYVSSIDAMDYNADAIASFKKDITDRNIDNINAIVQDIDELQNQSWDILLLSYFGKPDEQFKRVLKMAKEKTIMLRHGKTAEGDRRPDAETFSKFLIENAINHVYKIIDLEFGQPFTSIEDAERYFQIYSYKDGADQLIKTENSEFPLYYPKLKSTALFII